MTLSWKSQRLSVVWVFSYFANLTPFPELICMEIGVMMQSGKRRFKPNLFFLQILKTNPTFLGLCLGLPNTQLFFIQPSSFIYFSTFLNKKSSSIFMTPLFWNLFLFLKQLYETCIYQFLRAILE